MLISLFINTSTCHQLQLKSFNKFSQTMFNLTPKTYYLFHFYSWQSGKTLINRSNFFQDLEFYDKANMPDDIYHKLNVLFIQDPDFTPDFVRRASNAASSLCMWVHAVYAYASLHRNMRPKLNDVEMAEAKLQEVRILMLGRIIKF